MHHVACSMSLCGAVLCILLGLLLVLLGAQGLNGYLGLS